MENKSDQCRNYDEARETAIAFIGISHKSSGRIYDHLTRKGYDPDIAGQIVSDLCSDGYIDDLRVAKSVITKRRGRSAEARHILLQRLRAAGVSDDIMTSCEEWIPADEVSLQGLMDEKCRPDFLRRSADDDFDTQTWIQRTSRFLLSRGYSSHLIFEAFQRLSHDVE